MKKFFIIIAALGLLAGCAPRYGCGPSKKSKDWAQLKTVNSKLKT